MGLEEGKLLECEGWGRVVYQGRFQRESGALTEYYKISNG